MYISDKTRETISKALRYYDSIYIENRQDIDCFKMLFLIKFKVYYNFINDNNDINYVTTSDCMNLTKVRDKLNKFNDTFHHINYLPIVIPPTDHLTYQLVTWIILSILLLIIASTCTQRFFLNNKNNKINIINTNQEESNKIQDEIINEVVIPDNSNNNEFPLQIKAELEEISDLDEILNLDLELAQKN